VSLVPSTDHHHQFNILPSSPIQARCANHAGGDSHVGIQVGQMCLHRRVEALLRALWSLPQRPLRLAGWWIKNAATETCVNCEIPSFHHPNIGVVRFTMIYYDSIYLIPIQSSHFLQSFCHRTVPFLLAGCDSKQ
jgi:hypothetical protein